jgi:hypothetical protein
MKKIFIQKEQVLKLHYETLKMLRNSKADLISNNVLKMVRFLEFIALQKKNFKFVPFKILAKSSK